MKSLFWEKQKQAKTYMQDQRPTIWFNLILQKRKLKAREDVLCPRTHRKPASLLFGTKGGYDPFLLVIDILY